MVDRRERVYQTLKERDYRAYIDALRYIEENSEAYFNHDLDTTELPLTPGERVALQIGIAFGISWEVDARDAAGGVKADVEPSSLPIDDRPDR